MEDTQAQAQAKADFVRLFVWNDDSVALLRNEHGGKCVFCEHDVPATHRLYDFEDEKSGGVGVCDTHTAEFQEHGHMEDWVTQDPEGAWNGIGPAEGSGWSGLWFIFAPPGRYSVGGEWPYVR